MTIDEKIEHLKREVDRLGECAIDLGFNSGTRAHYEFECQNAKQELNWLTELKELREFKNKMDLQYVDNLNDPLEPLKLSSALKSEIWKYEFRKKNSPKEINILDYTIIYALKYCLEEQLKKAKAAGGGKE